MGGTPDPLPVLAEARRFRRALDGVELHDVGRFLRVVEELGPWLAGRRGGRGHVLERAGPARDGRVGHGLEGAAVDLILHLQVRGVDPRDAVGVGEEHPHRHVAGHRQPVLPHLAL